MRIIKLVGVVISVCDARVYDSREVKVIKCKVKIIKCNVSVIEGRSLRSGQVIECMLLLLLLMFLCVWIIEGEGGGGRGPGGKGLTPLHTYCVPLPICKFRHHNFKHISL